MIDKIVFWFRWVVFWIRAHVIPARRGSLQLKVVEYGCGFMFYCPHCDEQTQQHDFLLTGAAIGLPGFIEQVPRHYNCEHCHGLIKVY